MATNRAPGARQTDDVFAKPKLCELTTAVVQHVLNGLFVRTSVNVARKTRAALILAPGGFNKAAAPVRHRKRRAWIKDGLVIGKQTVLGFIKCRRRANVDFILAEPTSEEPSRPAWTCRHRAWAARRRLDLWPSQAPEVQASRGDRLKSANQRTGDRSSARILRAGRQKSDG